MNLTCFHTKRKTWQASHYGLSFGQDRGCVHAENGLHTPCKCWGAGRVRGWGRRPWRPRRTLHLMYFTPQIVFLNILVSWDQASLPLLTIHSVFSDLISLVQYVLCASPGMMGDFCWFRYPDQQPNLKNTRRSCQPYFKIYEPFNRFILEFWL